MVIMMLAAIVAAGACNGAIGNRGIAQGWAGTVVTDDAVYIGSKAGKLVALDKSYRTRLWEDVAFEMASTGGFGGFGCAPTSIGVAIYGTPVIWNGAVYVAGYDGKIYSIDIESGRKRTFFPDEGSVASFVGSLAIDGGSLFIGSADGTVYALDAETGFMDWKYETGDTIWSSPTVADGVVYIGSFDKKLYAINVDNGALKWQPFSVTGAISATPLVSDGTVYFGSFDRHFYAVNTGDGSLRWKTPEPAGNWFWNQALLYDGNIYAANIDGKVYVLDAATGESVAAYDLIDPVTVSPVVLSGQIIAANKTGSVYSIDPQTRQLRLLRDIEEAIYAPIVAQDDMLYIHTDEDRLLVMDAESGLTLWSIKLSGE